MKEGRREFCCRWCYKWGVQGSLSERGTSSSLTFFSKSQVNPNGGWEALKRAPVCMDPECKAKDSNLYSLQQQCKKDTK